MVGSVLSLRPLGKNDAKRTKKREPGHGKSLRGFNGLAELTQTVTPLMFCDLTAGNEFPESQRLSFLRLLKRKGLPVITGLL
jgi:hypothetical protein